MNMTLTRFGLGNANGFLSALVMPVGILVLVAMMVLPLPAFLLDTFFITNILVSLLVLMVALHTYRPLDFSSFPSLLLIATVLRLGLNVASTRIILTSGHEGTSAAGKVIEAFGAFVIAGNYAVGIFVFVILVIINLVVITKGAGRVSEVTARFTLDAMPGKQMAIDADLNAGVLTNEEAKLRREDIAKESEFYGAMDGASKFVKGDAIAGILILAINIIGGLIIGVTQHDMSFSSASESYILLSIGDGLVAQIPSLMLAIATAIIVTRVSTTEDMAAHIGKQISLSRAWIPVSAVLLLIGFVPGMPNFLFLAAAAIAGIAGFLMRRREHGASELDAQQQSSAEALLEEVAVAANGLAAVTVGENTINFKAPYPRVPILDAIQEHTGIDVSEMDENALRETAIKLSLEVDETMGKGKLIDELFGECCEHHYIQPTFITDYPIEMSPLTKAHRSKPGLTERFELMVNGKELANAYSELNDPIDQRERFEDQISLSEKGDDEAMFIDQDFLRSLEYGMPPTSGIGIGIDRLTMLLTNNSSVQEVLFFPQMRPEKKGPTLKEEEQLIADLLKKESPVALTSLKEQSGLSNKKWDKAIKGLTGKSIAEVKKTDDTLTVSLR